MLKQNSARLRALSLLESHKDYIKNNTAWTKGYTATDCAGMALLKCVQKNKNNVDQKCLDSLIKYRKEIKHTVSDYDLGVIDAVIGMYAFKINFD